MWWLTKKGRARERARMYHKGYDDGIAAGKFSGRYSDYDSAKSEFINHIRNHIKYEPELKGFVIPEQILHNAARDMTKGQPPANPPRFE